MILRDALHTRGKPFCAFELKGPGVDLCALGARDKDTSSKAIAERFNLIFTRDKEKDECETKKDNAKDEKERVVERMDAKSASMTSRKPIEQAITYALSSSSGCVFVYNYSQGIALKLLDIDEERGKIRFLVSDAFHSGLQQGVFRPMEAMLTLCAHSLRRLQKYNSLLQYIESIANKVADICKSFEQIGNTSGASNLKRTATDADLNGSGEVDAVQVNKRSRGNDAEGIAAPMIQGEDKVSFSSDDSTYFDDSSVFKHSSKNTLSLEELQTIKTV